jgi:hypothetical protein
MEQLGISWYAVRRSSNMDKTTDILIQALKEAMSRPEEHLLYKAGKQAGLFATRSGLDAEAAQRALRDGLLEVIRSDIKGKVETNWVRITPRGVQFVYQHESPKAVLEELVSVLRLNQEHLPRWLEEIRAQLQVLTNRFTGLVERQGRYLDQLTQRAEEALRRLTADMGPGPLEPWQLDALDYLDRRKVAASARDCPLSELYNYLREKHAELPLAAFHEGLSHLRDRGAVELVPYRGHLSELAEPEVALLEGAAVFAFIRRS